jgi:hypothetical protein
MFDLHRGNGLYEGTGTEMDVRYRYFPIPHIVHSSCGLLRNSSAVSHRQLNCWRPLRTCRSIVDGDMGDTPVCLLDRVALVVRHAVAGPHNASELLGVQMQQIAWRRAFVAHHRPAESSALRLERPSAASTRLIVVTLRSTTLVIVCIGMRRRRNCSMRIRNAASTVVRVLPGRELRSMRPGQPRRIPQSV